MIYVNYRQNNTNLMFNVYTLYNLPANLFLSNFSVLFFFLEGIPLKLLLPTILTVVLEEGIVILMN